MYFNRVLKVLSHEMMKIKFLEVFQKGIAKYYKNSFYFFMFQDEIFHHT